MGAMAPDPHAATPSPPPSLPLDDIPLNDGTTLPAIGLGLYKVAPQDVGPTVNSAVGLGYRLLDGAMFYRNEPELGAAVRAVTQEQAVPREELLVASKFWGDPVQSYDAALADFETSFTDLGIGPLDLYFIHWPRGSRGTYVETWRALVRLREEGRVRSIAVASFSVEELTRLIEETGVAPAVNQVESHPWLPQHELRAFHAAHGIVTQAWSPLGRGRLLEQPPIVEIAARHGVTPAQVVLRWHLQLGGAAVPKSVHAERLRLNLDLGGFALDEDDMARIATLENGTRTGTDPKDRQ